MPKASGTVHQHELVESREGESVLGVFVGQISDAVEDVNRLALAETIFFSDCSGDLLFRECFSHSQFRKS